MQAADQSRSALGENADLPNVISREDLYALVWSEPMSHLAVRFGMSDVGLAQACARMLVPVPGRGYWAKKEVGRSPRPTRLPTLPANSGDDKRELRVHRREAPDAAELAREEPSRIEVVVPEVLVDPHPLVARTVRAFRGGRSTHDGFLSSKTPDCLSVTATMACIDRAMRIYDALIRAIEERGYVVDVEKHRRQGYTEPEHRTVVLLDGEKVEIALIEVTKRIERKREGLTDPSPKYETIPSGRLSAVIREQFGGTRQRWVDDAKRTLESQLGSFIHGLAEAAVAFKEFRRAQEDRERKQLEEQQRAWDEAQRKRAQASRVRALNTEIDSMHSARWAREYLAALKANLAAHPEAETPEMRLWVSWVEEYASDIDPFNHAAKIPKDPNPYS